MNFVKYCPRLAYTKSRHYDVDAFTNYTCENFANYIQSDNRKFRSRPIVGKKARHCTRVA